MTINFILNHRWVTLGSNHQRETMDQAFGQVGWTQNHLRPVLLGRFYLLWFVFGRSDGHTMELETFLTASYLPLKHG